MDEYPKVENRNKTIHFNESILNNDNMKLTHVPEKNDAASETCKQEKLRDATYNAQK